MRFRAAVSLALAAAVLGGAAVLVVGRSVGWIHGGSTTVVVRTTPAEVAAPAVVEPVAKPILGGFQPARIFQQRSAGVVTIVSYFAPSNSPDAPAAQGSGFVVSAAGLILTNSHVITNAGESDTGGSVSAAREVYVEFRDGDRVPAHVVGYDLFDDVGVIRVDPRDHALSPVPLGNSDAVQVGQPVAAIGSPFGNQTSLTIGIVSAIHRSISSLTSKYDLPDAIQTDAPINHGNSGGPLFDAGGRVIGINAQIRSGAGQSGFEGVGFAVPIDSASRSMRQLLASGRVAYAYVGISTEDLTPSIARRFHVPAQQGALIDKVERGSAGEHAGLRAGTNAVAFEGEQVTVGGDAIVAIDGIPVRNAGDVVRIVSERLEPGQLARFSIVRGASRLVVPVKLTERPLS